MCFFGTHCIHLIHIFTYEINDILKFERFHCEKVDSYDLYLLFVEEPETYLMEIANN